MTIYELAHSQCHSAWFYSLIIQQLLRCNTRDSSPGVFCVSALPAIHWMINQLRPGNPNLCLRRELGRDISRSSYIRGKKHIQTQHARIARL
jgi:hypothetical protein